MWNFIARESPNKQDAANAVWIKRFLARVGRASLTCGVRRHSRMYQLVLQFPAFAVDLDDLIEIEDELLATIRPPAIVDGHDFGTGEGNIFILTDSPAATFEGVLPVLKSLSRERDVTAAYRSLEGEEYTVIWPKGFKGEFSVG